MKPLLVDGIQGLRDGHVLLERICCEVRAGQVTGIIADNPDTLNFFLNILGGLEREHSGRILFAGKPWSTKERLRGVGIAREKVALVDSLSVLDNLYLSNNRLFTWFGFIHRSRRRAHAKAVIQKLESQVAIDHELQSVKPHTKVMLDIARVLIMDPAYCVFHGVTRGMSLTQYTAFASVIQGLKASGKAILLIPINAEDVRKIVDRLYYLQGTQMFEVDNLDALTDEQLNAFFLGNEKKRYQTSSDPVQHAQHLMAERVNDQDLDFQELAKAVGMSYDNFRRRFKQQTGMSPNQYFISVKVDRAKELLLFTDLEIKDVALQVGFSDPYYFSRFFKERTSTSPIHFRKGDREQD